MASHEQIAQYLNAGRWERIACYVFLVFGGVSALFYPSTVLLEQSSSTVSRVCMVVWVVCSSGCLIGAVRRTWSLEYILLPFLSLALGIFAAALGAQAIPGVGDGKTTPSTLSYAFFFLGFASLLMNRHAKVRVVYRADAERSLP